MSAFFSMVLKKSRLWSEVYQGGIIVRRVGRRANDG